MFLYICEYQFLSCYIGRFGMWFTSLSSISPVWMFYFFLSGLSVYSVTVFLLLECFCWTPPSLHSSSFYFPDRNFWIKLLYIGMFLLTRQKKKKYLPEACCCSWSSEKAPAGLWWKISLFLAVSTGDYWGSENCPSFTSEVKLDVLESLSSTVLSQLSNLEI